MAEFQLPQNWTEWRPHAQQDAVRAPGVARRATPPGQGGSSGSAEPQGSSGRGDVYFNTPSLRGANGGATLREDERPYPLMSEGGLRDLGSRWFGGPGVEPHRVPGQVTPANNPHPPRPANVTPAKMSAMDLLYMMAEVPARNGTSPFQGPSPTTPHALRNPSPFDFLPPIPHGTGAAYPFERAMGLPVPGRTP